MAERPELATAGEAVPIEPEPDGPRGAFGGLAPKKAQRAREREPGRRKEQGKARERARGDVRDEARTRARAGSGFASERDSS